MASEIFRPGCRRLKPDGSFLAKFRYGWRIASTIAASLVPGRIVGAVAALRMVVWVSVSLTFMVMILVVIDDATMNALFYREAKQNLIRPICMLWAGVLQSTLS
jgi:hypothetical protein